MKDFLKKYKNKIFWGTEAILISLAIFSVLAFFSGANKPDLAVSFFDVGKVNSIFVESKDGAQILIDGGPPNRILPLLGGKMAYFDRFIDVVVLTHPHADHVSGLIEVLEKYRVGMVIESGVEYHTAEAKIFENLVKEKNIKKIIIDRPANLPLSRGAVLKFIYPEKSCLGETLKNVHDSALVSELDFDGKKILLMADAEKKTELYLVENKLIGDIDILKAGHHGSKTSSNGFFLEAVRPEYAVISSGRKNRYGHPNPEV